MSPELKLPLVSIVITSYNYARFVGDALDSVSRQTYRPLECIVVDDCSTDDSPEVIRRKLAELEKTDNGISYSLVSTERNSGQLAAFQTGLAHARGVFVNFLDADDFLFPDFISVHVQIHLESMVAFTFSEPVEIDGENQIHCFQSNTGSNYRRLDLKRHVRPVGAFETCSDDICSCDAAKGYVTSSRNVLNRNDTDWLHEGFWHPTSSAVFRRSALRFFGCADAETWRICADCLLFCYAVIVGSAYFVPFRLSAYRRHGGNAFAGGEMVGEYGYLSDKSVDIVQKMHGSRLALSLIEVFANFKKGSPVLAQGFMQVVVYQAGALFLLSNWRKVFAHFPELGFGRRCAVMLKTIVRHRQIKRRWKRG